MKKRILSLVLALVLCLSLSATAFASSEASGEASGGMSGSSAVYAYAVTADGVEETEAEDVSLEGNITAAGISQFDFSSTETDFVSVVGDDTTEGAVSFVLGGEEATYDAADLDINERAQELLGFQSFDSKIDSTTGTLITASGGAYLELDGIYATGTTGIVTAGSDSDRYSGSSDEDYIDTVVVIRDCYLDSETGTAIADANWPHGTSLMVRGSIRSSLSIGESETYYYGTAVIVDGWAAMATDSAVGMGLDMVAYNSYARTLLGGYCSYSDSRCRDYLYGTVYESAEYGSIIANFGELYILSTDDAAVDTNVIRAESEAEDLDERAAIDPLAYANEDDIVTETTGSVVAGFRNAIMMHVPDLMGGGGSISDAKGVLYVKDSTIATYEELAPEDYATGEYKDSWIEKTDEATWAYLEYTMGATILIRSDNAFIHLTNATVESWTGVLLQTALNADANGNWIGADEEIADNIGIDVIVDGTTALVGNINHEDYQRTLTIVFEDSASLTGDIFTGTVDTWHEKFADYAESGANYYRDVDGYDTIWGTYVTLEAGTTWTVVEQSNITGLTVEEGAVLNGVVTVDGETVDVTAGGTWEGDIVITAA
ncbi:MAG: hypothetical protein LUH42_00590 [Oscillospiraceae bacterium]|nr:hypothetical protein [Oscillospiraceae bacterium]